MINIDDPTKVEKTPAIWRLAFRPFFLGGAVIAALYIPLWLVSWFIPGYSLFSTQFWTGVVPLWWHPHEMLFGFGLAIVSGFLLTAVQNWTQQPSLTGMGLALTFSCWLCARLALIIPIEIPIWLPALFDSAFLVLVAGTLWRCIYRVRQWRNIIFPLMIILAFGVNLISYYALSQRDFSLASQLWQAMIWWLALVITLIGGRVIPFFTAIRIKQTKAQPIAALEYSIFLLMALLFVQAMSQGLPPLLERGLLLTAGLLQLLRQARWLPHQTCKEPMLWSLQVSYFSLPMTLLALAWQFESEAAYRAILHLFTIGGIASLCLAMMSRVSLGHTSRNIYDGPNMALAFAALPIAGVLRAIFPLYFPQHSAFLYWLSGSLWFVAFALFIWHYTLILIRPRIDGRPG